MNTLYRRIIPKILITYNPRYKMFSSTVTKNFKVHRFVGHPTSQALIYESNIADELMILNVEPQSVKIKDFLNTIRDINSVIHMPMSVGGGISSLDEAKLLFNLGVEKVVIGQAFQSNPKGVSDIVKIFGSQSLIGSCAYWGSKKTPMPRELQRRGVLSLDSLTKRIKVIEDIGAGELLINDVSRDGLKIGSNLDVLKKTLSVTNIPVIDSCGFGKTKDFVDSFELGSAAVAVGTYFAFTDQSFLQLRNQLSNHGIRVRLQ